MNPLHQLSDKHQEVALNAADESVRTRHMVRSGDIKGYALVVDGWAAPLVAAIGSAIEYIEDDRPTTARRNYERAELLGRMRAALDGVKR